MKEEFLRGAMLLGGEGIQKLHNSHAAVFGLGGVGSYAAEALVRAGVGQITAVDSDTVSLSNINRQLIALHSTVGMPKTEAFALRAKDINPEIRLNLRSEFFLPENSGGFDFSAFDYVIDAVDTVAAKLTIVQKCREAGTPVISCMGTGNKLQPELLTVCCISRTKMCPLARVMRTELKKRGIYELQVVYSPEEPIKPLAIVGNDSISGAGRKTAPGSVSFVTGAAGLMAAGEAIRYLCGR